MGAPLRRRRDDVTATSKLRSWQPSQDTDSFAHPPDRAIVDALHDPEVLRQNRVTGIGFWQQRYDLEQAGFPRGQRLQGSRIANDDVRVIGRIEKSIIAFDEDRAELLDEAIKIVDVANPEDGLELLSKDFIRDAHFLHFFPATRMNDDGVGKIEPTMLKGLEQLEPYEKREAKNQEWLPPVPFDEAQHIAFDDIQVRIQRENGLGAELHHSQHACATRCQHPWIRNDLSGVDDKQRQPACAQDRTEYRHETTGLPLGGLCVHNNPARLLTCRSTGLQCEGWLRRRGQFKPLEQCCRQIGDFFYLCKGLATRIGGVKYVPIRDTALIVMTRELRKTTQQERRVLAIRDRECRS